MGKLLGSNIGGFVAEQPRRSWSLMLHALTRIPLTGESILVNSNDTDVFVLFVSLIQYAMWKSNHEMVKWYANRSNENKHRLRRRAVGLIGLHASTGCDIIENVFGKSKQTWLKAFLEAKENIVEAFTSYPHKLTTNFERELERFVCNVYVPKVNFSNVKDVRWNGFKINSSNVSLLSPSLVHYITYPNILND